MKEHFLISMSPEVPIMPVKVIPSIESCNQVRLEAAKVSRIVYCS
jgi:hypothetical protein